MTTVADTPAVPAPLRDKALPGVQPLEDSQRRLSGRDLAVLWGDLSVGLLVLVTGALLVPALGLPQALAAIIIGGVLGCAALSLVGRAGQREGVPTMVLLRPALGARGSYVPSVLNLVQLVGWTAVELWAMARVANAVSVEAFSLDLYPVWLVVMMMVCGGLALLGPVVVVRRWMERFGVWVLGAAGLFLTWKVLGSGQLAAAWSRPGTGGLSFFAAIDLTIVMPLSWLPLVADYNRLSTRDARAGAGTFWGYFIGNTWFYSLGALLVLTAGARPDVVGLGGSILSLAGGLVVILVLLVGETDQAFANIYSGAVSAQNVWPRLAPRWMIVAITVTGGALASVLTMDLYESFLFLIGSVFVPLFAVFAASYFVWKVRGFGAADLFDRSGAAFARGGVRWGAMIAWGVGFLVYHATGPYAPAEWMSGFESLFRGAGAPYPLFGGALGASLPGFVAAFALAIVLVRPRPRQTSG